MPCRILSSPSPLLISIVFLLLLLISINGSPVTNSPATSSCPNSATCGKQLITYPFWVHQNPTSYCGNEGFMLICEDDDRLILSLGSHNYTVTKIDYPTRTFSIADTDFLDAGICPWPRHNLSFEGNSVLDYTSWDINLTFFLNCSFGDVLIDNKINCSLPGSSGKSSYIFTDEYLSTAIEYNLAQRCQGIVVVPVLNDPPLSDIWSHLLGDFGELLKNGFQLRWPDEISGACDRCESSGGRCGYTQPNSTSWVFACFCSGVMRDHSCGSEAFLLFWMNKRFFISISGLDLYYKCCTPIFFLLHVF
ncbi:LEAF RUST 10 DISEASE-RESISTANCE LOCUS RECEPTOR-LIKE PROTEIN KINASE-like 1.2 [Phoenix dactylifera]|uniref:LEAF RUST 10 DISEASE-RESISTANCE LOCUS RECEPTOR-LIKE PROTEIN KINASE-like 1.2 n=1 Tax=Phoenix dactylifera TaxID=42345 RepID=A0A8B8J7P6_PHODC|nr:LEAF RUST 10 DISEASE-RESISTANCE LOCUS RECEPTOR-LIKE PROTEIN KINASE-like 1.2 [Phoenix dactylifera]